MTEQEQTSLHVPFGAGRDRPGFTFRGSVDEIKTQVGEAFGIKIGSKTAAELAVEAGTWATTLGDAAAEIGYKLPPDSMTTSQFRTNIQAGSIAQRAREEQPPPPGSVDDALAWGISRARDRDQIVKLRKENRPHWFTEHDELARQRLAELEGTA